MCSAVCRRVSGRLILASVVALILLASICHWTMLLNWEDARGFIGTARFYTKYGNLSVKEISLRRRIGEKALKILAIDNDLALDVWINKGNLKYDDPLLVEYVREIHLLPPKENKPYRLKDNLQNPSEGQVQSVMNFFKNMTTGFFVDCGAHDGEFISNTLWLEKEMHWSGLLIEADPETFRKLRLKNRKAWHSNVCLSNDKAPKTTSFFRNPENSGLAGLHKRKDFGVTDEIKVQCFPFYTMLLALNRTVVDFFSLDIEGLELEVLKTIPFDKILIKTFAIEHWSIPEGAEGLKTFMEANGFVLHTTISTGLSRDSVFVHKSVLDGSVT